MRMIFGRFVPGDSPLHNIHPRVRVLGFALLISAGLLVQSWRDLAVTASMVFIVVLASGLRFGDLFRDMWALRFLFLITLALHSILWRGEALLDLPFGMTLTAGGVQRGLFFTAKIALLAAFIGPLMRTTHPAAWADLFNFGSLRVGWFGRFSAALALTLGIAVRFLPLIVEEAERIRWAQLSRGFRYERNLLKRLRSTGQLLLPLLNSSLDRVDGITTAMLARGYRLGSERTVYRKRRLKANDLVAMILVFAVLLLVIV